MLDMADKSGALNCSAAADWACGNMRMAFQGAVHADKRSSVHEERRRSGDGCHLCAQVLNLSLPENDVRVARRALEHVRLGNDEENLQTAM